MNSLRIGCALLFLLSPAGAAIGAETGLHHGVVWYSEAPEAVADLAADRYEVGVTGKDLPNNKVRIKNLNPDFRWFVYNSGTDNYVPPFSTGEHELLESKTVARGWDIEDAYLHYYDDTEVVLQGDTLFIPGLGGGSAVDPAEARIPVYNRDLGRRLCNFSVPHASQAYREVFIERSVATPFPNTNLYPDGIFLDNSSGRLFNHGKILSGGRVRETPGNPRIYDVEFQDWHWNQNLGPFLSSFKDTLETSATWSADGNRKYLMINTADVWNDDYVALDVADVLFMEFQYNPVRNFGVGLVGEAYRRDALAASAGITCFYAAIMATFYDGHLSSYADVMIGNLAWYLTTRTDNTLFFEFANATPHVAGWDTLTWRGVLDVANSAFGAAAAPPFVLAEGTDPLGNPYAVYAREYEGGMSLVRNRGQYDEGIEPETAVTVPLPRPLAPVSVAGDIGDVVEEVTLRNGRAAIFLNPVVPVSLLSFTVEWEQENAVIRWEVGSASTDHAGFRVYREGAEGERLPVDSTVHSHRTLYVVTDPGAPLAGARYWLAELTRSGTTEWHGPTVLAPSPGTGPSLLRLAQNHPNPCRANTLISFTMPEEGPARLTLFDVTGREVVRLFDGRASTGPNRVTWDGRSSHGGTVPFGVYFYRLETVSGALTRKLAFLPSAGAP